MIPTTYGAKDGMNSENKSAQRNYSVNKCDKMKKKATLTAQNLEQKYKQLFLLSESDIFT